MKYDRCLIGDAEWELTKVPDNSVQMCATSPPYFQLRDYGMAAQIGREATVDEYVARLVRVFAQIKRVLTPHGTLWLNLGDGYDANKNLIGIPWRVAFALQNAGWILRSEIIWHKPNPMPSPVRDRPTSAHEHVFLFAKTNEYYYDAEAIKTPIKDPAPNGKPAVFGGSKKHDGYGTRSHSGREYDPSALTGANARDVWTVASSNFPGAHFAVWPAELVKRMVLAGSCEGDVVLDPFMGSGTTAEVAQNLGRRWLGCELNPEYVEIQGKRTAQTTLFQAIQETKA